MKSLLKYLALAAACVLTSLSLFSQTQENFNSRSGIDVLNVTSFLESRCWQFSNFAITTTGNIEGDGSLTSLGQPGAANLYTPVLNIWGNFALSFKYSFNGTSSEARSINIYLTNANNEIISLLDNINVTGAAGNTIFTYNKTLPGNSTICKLLITYQGGSTALAVTLDNIFVSVNQRYVSGCNEAPVAESDIVIGNEDRSASGYIAQNDTDPNGEALSAYLISDSKDGHVIVALNGYFTFVPNAGFTGDYTSFTYQVCDYGYNILCSQEATVMVSFPSTLPVEVSDLQANYGNNGVTVKWITNAESNSDRFEIERSTDGIRFQRAGTVKALGNSSTKHAYVFEDQVSETLTRKNDLFYRLKQVDRDGRSTYSKVLVVRVFKTKTLQTVSVTPNPAVNDIKVNMQLNEHAYVVIKLRAINGEEIIRKSVKGFKGDNSFHLEGSEKIKKGVYMLEVIINSNERMLIKLVKN
jgi:hypothetical protein